MNYLFCRLVNISKIFLTTLYQLLFNCLKCYFSWDIKLMCQIFYLSKVFPICFNVSGFNSLFPKMFCHFVYCFRLTIMIFVNCSQIARYFALKQKCFCELAILNSNFFVINSISLNFIAMSLNKYLFYLCLLKLNK